MNEILERIPNSDINEWVTARGFTIEGRKRDGSFWEITVAEDLNVSQKSAFETQVENLLKRIEWL